MLFMRGMELHVLVDNVLMQFSGLLKILFTYRAFKQFQNATTCPHFSHSSNLQAKQHYTLDDSSRRFSIEAHSGVVSVQVASSWLCELSGAVSGLISSSSAPSSITNLRSLTWLCSFCPAEPVVHTWSGNVPRWPSACLYGQLRFRHGLNLHMVCR